MSKEIESIIDEIRPVMKRDGGDIEFVEYQEKDGIVYVKLSGACQGCPMSQITLKYVVEAALMERIPSIKEVRIV